MELQPVEESISQSPRAAPAHPATIEPARKGRRGGAHSDGHPGGANPDPPVRVTPLYNTWLHRFASLVAWVTLLLVTAGASVTSTGSGLAVPDWPLSFGGLFPPMVGGVLFEHGHRMIAGLVLVLTTILTVWLFRRERRVWVRRLGLAALLALFVQALLGGLTVLLRLPAAISAGHAGLAMAFFGAMVSIALVTSRGWLETPQQSRPMRTTGIPSLQTLSLITTVAIYLQILMGAVMRHTGAGLAIPDFPLSFGRLFPPVFSAPIIIHFAHRLGAVAVSLCVVLLVVRIVRNHRHETKLFRPALLLFAMLLSQILLGALTIWTGRAVLVTTAHVAFGAAILAVSLVLTLRCYRFFRVPEGSRGGLLHSRGLPERGGLVVSGEHPQGGAAPIRLTAGPVEAGDKSTGKFHSGAIRDYLELTKPRIVFLILLTTAAGFYVGAYRSIELLLLLTTIVGTGLVVAGANVLNQLVERDADARMRRTQNRPLPAGRLQPREALYFGMGMSVVGLLVLLLGVNPLTALLGLVAWVTYLLFYTPLKKRTSLSTLVGAVSGALPPVLGWTAVRNGLSIEAAVLFLILFFWQLPHFLAIAWMYREDYARAGFAMLPVLDPEGGRAGRQIVVYGLALLPVSLLPALLGLAGTLYFFGALVLSLVFLGFGVRTAFCKSRLCAKHLFLASLLFLPALLALMMLDKGAI